MIQWQLPFHSLLCCSAFVCLVKLSLWISSCMHAAKPQNMRQYAWLVVNALLQVLGMLYYVSQNIRPVSLRCMKLQSVISICVAVWSRVSFTGFAKFPLYTGWPFSVHCSPYRLLASAECGITFESIHLPLSVESFPYPSISHLSFEPSTHQSTHQAPTFQRQ